MGSSAGAFSFVWCLLGFILWLAMLGWVYNDATEKGHGGCIWLFLVFIFGFTGLIVYLIFFHGMPAIGNYRATRRDEDLQYRSMYRSSISEPESRASGNTWGQTSPMLTTPMGDPGFFDEELDRLIKSGKFTEARDYLTDMKSMAREMDDVKGLANYQQYDGRITGATNIARRKASSSRF